MFFGKNFIYRFIEVPSVAAHEVVHDVNGNDVLQALELPHDQGAVGPRAGQRHVQMVATALRLKAAAAIG